MTVYVGELRTLSANFKSPADSSDIDPSTVSIDWRAPGESLQTRTYGAGGSPAIIKDSTGNYSLLLDLDKPGVWSWRWYSTGSGQASKVGERHVAAVPV